MTSLWLFDNPLPKYLIFKRINCIQWLFWVYLPKLKRGPRLTVGAHFMHDFPIDIFIINTL